MKKLLIFIAAFGFYLDLSAQSAQMPIQGIIENESGPIANNDVNIRISLFSDGILEFEEIHETTTNELGLFQVIVGKGNRTGNGIADSFDEVHWFKENIYIKIESDIKRNSNYTEIGSSFLTGVPYAFYANKSAGSTFSNLSDFKSQNPEYGDGVLWDGSNWYYNKPPQVEYSENVQNTAFADTAYFVKNAIRLNGNFESPTIGTNNNEDLIFKTNGLERFKINAQGQPAFDGNPASTFSLKNGILHTGSLDSSAVTYEQLGNYFFWDPTHDNVRAGLFDDTTITDSLMSYSSFAGGKNSIAHKGSFAWGDNCRGVGFYNTIFGRNNTAVYRDSRPKVNGSVVIGQGGYSGQFRQVVLGYEGRTERYSTAFSMGYQNFCRGTVSYAIGYRGYIFARLGGTSYAFGYYPRITKHGNFVFTDATNKVQNVETDIPNQFMVRASGGTLLYTSPDLQSGVKLTPGAGAWTSVSDKNQKDNFETVEYESILSKIKLLDLSYWNYKSQDETNLHLGPMAQDFYSIFGIGADEKRINTIDLDGVTFAGIKGITERVDHLQSQLLRAKTIHQISQRVESDLDSIEKRFDILEAQLRSLH